jgi:hypothetical protein
MPTITAGTIIDNAETVLQDTTNVRWAAAELLAWLNDGMKAATILKPSICTVTKSVQLSSGARQTLGSGSTADAYMLLQVHCNMGTAGTEPADTVTLVSRQILDTQLPSWRATDTETDVECYMFDPQTPLQFYVYPPNDGTGYVEMTYSAIPTACASTASTISINDVYAPALLDYILFRAYSKDAEYGANAQRAVAHFKAFHDTLSTSQEVQLTHNQNVENTGFNPAVPAGAK